MFLSRLNLDSVKAAIAAGHIVMVPKNVTVTAKALKAQGITPETVKAAGFDLDKDGDLVYPALFPETRDGQGMIALCLGKMEPATEKPATGKDERTEEQKRTGVCDIFNYALDLDIRADIRPDIMGKLESPEKAIARAIDPMVAAGFTREKAIRSIVEQMIESGRVSADYVYVEPVK